MFFGRHAQLVLREDLILLECQAKVTSDSPHLPFCTRSVQDYRFTPSGRRHIVPLLPNPAMKRASSLKLFGLFCLLLQFACATPAEDLKKIHPTGYVSDLAGAIASDTKDRLEALCTELQQKTGSQMAIVTVHSLEGESIENYAVDLYKQLGVG